MSKPCNQLEVFLHYWLAMLIVFWVLVSCTGGDNKNPSNPNPTPPTGGPSFVINSPKDGSSIAGTIYFSAQPFDVSEVASVNFKAGNTDLGTDSTSNDGFKTFLNAKDFPKGTLDLTAILTGKNGKTSIEKITVTNVPSPSSSARTTAEGATLGTTEANGALSTLVIPAGVTEGANVTFEAKTKEDVKAATGVDYDSLGVTFLGAQEITASKPLDSALAITSGGFGPMVQPNQVVVNYMITPDGDGDGVGELVVINTASVTPNGDIISDPVPEIQLGSATITTGSRTQTLHTLQSGTISGPPGTFIEIEAPTGFNPFSAFGNVATFKSLVDSTIIEVPAMVNGHYEKENGVPTIGTYIPVLPAGAATLSFSNVSSKASAEPFTITVETAPPLTEKPEAIIDQALADLITALEDESDLQDAVVKLKDARNAFVELSKNPTPSETQTLNDIAVLLANSNMDDLIRQIDTLGTNNIEVLQCSGGKTAFGTAIAFAGLLAMFAGALLLGSNPVGWAFAFGVGIVSGGSVLSGVGLGVLLSNAFDCFFPPPSCATLGAPPSQNGTGPVPAGLGLQQTNPNGNMTGMGSVVPPGGDGCGTAVGDNPANSSSLQSQNTGLETLYGNLAGRFIVKVFYGAGNSVPFTGVSDSGGYFYIPSIPAGQPFEAIAFDTLTNESRSFKGTGQKLAALLICFLISLQKEQMVAVVIYFLMIVTPKALMMV